MNAALAAEGIIEDLSDRRGLRHEWEAIDKDIHLEFDARDLVPSGPTVREMALASLSIPMGEFVDDLL